MAELQFYLQFLPRIIPNNCVRILVLYYMLMNYDIFEFYIRHQMLALLKENMICIYNKNLENIANNYVRISGVLQQFSV